ncbi:hypothetical protein J7W19_04360 [Streptomyces mobaraensis NBRC 13819 = DSM 40847]|nr:aromatic acid exporter family protein [Streptomyces mobaraensis]QTT72768.1 hypothetical protein J7W19_04360 [Streptomyces mobaraensis NBRC 13819 = DSM 40847]
MWRERTMWRRTVEEVAAAGRALRGAWQGPGRERELVVLAFKATLAAVAAWALAAWLLTNTLALMAPWVALLLVRTTVYRSLAQAAQQTLAIALGTVMATAGGMLLGGTLTAMAVVLPVALLAGNWQHFGDQGLAGATSALFTLAGGEWSVDIAVDRVLAALLGAVVGVAVNAFVLPPVSLRSARESIGEVVTECRTILEAMAEGVSEGCDHGRAVGWQERVRRLPRLLAGVRSAIGWAEESARFNPHRRRSELLWRAKPSYEETAHTLEHVVDHLEGLSRTLVEATDPHHPRRLPGPDAARPYGDFLHRVARALCAYGRSVTGGDPAAAREELLRELRGVEEAHGTLRARLAGQASDDPEAIELIGSLLAEARRLTQRLRVPDDAEEAA